MIFSLLIQHGDMNYIKPTWSNNLTTYIESFQSKVTDYLISTTINYSDYVTDALSRNLYFQKISHLEISQ